MAQNNFGSPASSELSTKAFIFGTAIVGLILALIVALCVFLLWRHEERATFRQDETKRLLNLDNKTRAAIISDVNSVRSNLGRAPVDQAELESLLGKSMPVVHDRLHPVPIIYERTGRNSFILHYELGATDDWVYDSEKPNAGWVQHSY
jgi:hypothetical protein